MAILPTASFVCVACFLPFRAVYVGKWLFPRWLATDTTLARAAEAFIHTDMPWPSEPVTDLAPFVPGEGDLTDAGGQVLDGWGNPVWAVPSTESSIVLSLQSPGPDGVFQSAPPDEVIVAIDVSGASNWLPWPIARRFAWLMSGYTWCALLAAHVVLLLMLLMRFPMGRRRLSLIGGTASLLVGLALCWGWWTSL